MVTSLRLLLVGSFLLLTSACTTTSGGSAGLRAQTSFAPEASRTWSRPTEVGYDFTGEEIEGSASATSILFGLINFGAKDVSLLSSVTGILTGAGSEDPLAHAAAYDAMMRAQNVDGIYITKQTSGGVNILGIYKKQDTTVVGKALRLRVIGEVAQERADRERYLLALPVGSTVGAAAGTATTPSIIEQILGK